MTQFRVLPVRRGDAFLLKSRRGSYLVDGGAQESLLPEMLIDRRIKKLRAVVCSSTCPERLGGIVEILEAGLPVAEYWFPERVEVLPELARRFNGDWNGWLCSLGLADHENFNIPAGWSRNPGLREWDESHRRLEGAALLVALALTACTGEPLYQGLSRNAFLYDGAEKTPLGLAPFFESVLGRLSARAEVRKKNGAGAVNKIMRRMGWQLFSDGSLEDLILLCGRLLLAEAESLLADNCRGIRATIEGLSLAAMTIAMVAKNGACFRFFRQTGRLEEYFVPRHPLMCLNGVEVLPLSGLSAVSEPETISQEARAMVVQNGGLAFQYGDGDCGVLFCGDNKIDFLERGQVLTLDRPTIIASPRQGNCSCDVAYGRIVSNNPAQDVWVRTHYSYSRKVSLHFKGKPKKLCLNSCVHHTVQEMLLSNSEGQWNRMAGATCVCG